MLRTLTLPQINCDYWAKMGKTWNPYALIAHLLDTAASALVLWDHWLNNNIRDLLTTSLGGDPEYARRQVAYAAAVHDIGKANPIFQLQLASKSDVAWRGQLRAKLDKGGYPLLDRAADWGGATGHLVKRHEAVGYHILNGGMPQDVFADPRQEWAAATTLGHHGRFLETGSPYGTDLIEINKACQGPWGDGQRAHLNFIGSVLGVHGVEGLTGPYASAALILLSGFVQLADHLASEDTAVDIGRALKPANACVTDPVQWVQDREAWFAKRLPDTLGVYRNPDNPLDAVMKGRRLSSLQKDALRIGGGLWIVMSPTGDGKTEAAGLRHMNRSDEGMLFALPTRATADAIMNRTVEWFKSVDVLGGIAHGASSLHPFYVPPQVTEDCGEPDEDVPGGVKAGAWYDRQARALLNPVLVSTSDQVLQGALNQRGAPMRLLALANKHVVLDEVHTYDLYQTELLCELLAWWGATRTRVTLLSATLETWQRDAFARAYHRDAPQVIGEKANLRLPDHVLIDPATGEGESPDDAPQPRLDPYDVRLDLVDATDQAGAHIAWAKEMRARYPRARIGIVTNTVDAAIRISRELAVSGDDVLLHSRMVAGHRSAVTQRLLEALGRADDPEHPGRGHGEGITVVGTQVLEASLDIDLDLLSTDLAPVPSLVQRDGRKWRFEDDERRRERIGDLADPSQRSLRIVARVDESGQLDDNQLPYLTAVLRKARASTQATRVLRVPSGIQEYVDSAAVSLEDALSAAADPGASSEDRSVLDSLMRRDQAAGHVKVAMRGEDGLLEDMSYAGLIALTSRSGVFTESATRFMDVNSETFVLVDPTGEHPYAMHTTVADLLQVGAGETGVLRAALAASVPTSGRICRLMGEAAERTLAGHEWLPRARMLRDYRPVDVAELGDLAYTEEGLGLRQSGTV